MATVEFRYDPKNTAWFTANAAMVLKAGEPAYHDTTGLFKLGDGVTALSALSFLPTGSASTPTIQQVLTAGQVATTTIETTGFIKTGGTFGEFLKADGSVDNNYYLTFSDISASTPLNYSNLTGVFSINQSSALSDGYLSSTDWSTFNGKTTLAAVNAQNLSVFAATTSSQLAGVISDETGTGALVFGTSPTFTTNITTPQITGVSGNLTLTNAIQSSGAITQFTFTNVANTNQTATSNIPNFRISGANKQWATGTVANQYWNYLTANTAAFVGASTMTNSYGLFVEAATAGTNATITNNYAAGFDGNIHQLNNGTNGIKFIPLVGGATYSAIYMNQATPSGINYTLACGGGDTYIRGTTSLSLVTNQAIISISTTQIVTTDGINYSFGTTGGTKLGVSTTQKLSFWNATPIVQPSAVTTVQGFYNAMSSIGLIASGTITLPTGYGRSINNIAINTTGAAAANTDYYYFCTATLTFTLPTAVGNTNTYYIKVTSGTLTIDTTSSQTIDGSLTIVTSVANTAFTLISDGTNWQII